MDNDITSQGRQRPFTRAENRSNYHLLQFAHGRGQGFRMVPSEVGLLAWCHAIMVIYPNHNLGNLIVTIQR
jgi:hypothetical protein